jgi:hypothetical protein
MKHPIVLLLAAGGILFAAPAAERTAWQWEAPLEVVNAGMVRLDVPSPVLDAARADLGDMRVVSPAGVETPYLVEVPVRRGGGARDAVGFKMVLSGRSTVIEAASGTVEEIEAIHLVSPAREFLKAVGVEGRKGGGEWQSLAASEVIFRQTGGAERMRLPVPAGQWDGLRVTMDDGRTQAVPFTGLRVIAVAEAPPSVEHPILLGTREEVSGQTRLTLDLGGRNLHVAELRFAIPDAIFSRACSLAFSTPTADGGTRMEVCAQGTLYRVAGDGGVSAEELVMPVYRRLPVRYVVATFRNGDSPPLVITGAKLRCYPTVMAFHAGQAGTWQVLTGNPGAKAPDYDLSPLRGVLAAAGGQRLVPGPLRAKADYQAAPPLPGVEPAGVDIGLTDWTRRRALDSVSAGVIGIELDALTLAGCRLDLGDLRLVQNNRQIPYLVKPGTVMRDLKPTMMTVPQDPKRPSLARWKISLPVDGLPAVDLTARSSAPMFSRRFVATFERKDDLGNTWTENAGAANWTKSGGGDVPLVLNLGGKRLPRTLVLETDHGDNPPIPVDAVVVRFAAPSITAKLTDRAPLFLYYGNAKAAPPQYDLRLVRDELLAADQQPARLGEEEMLRPDPRRPGAVDAGSPWLWLALGGVVVVLLGIVAKLLPRAAEN